MFEELEQSEFEREQGPGKRFRFGAGLRPAPRGL
jgi:hypothetical protein